mmetsp:Transcript_12217/g.17402  ORF Transcript_12217/g.17402 Transcript_12217/m.17402 type:complete len:412 (+) Transcript_12217:57-1292(+)|eukprot:CAMPEP_0175102124 /NCGR_PEP_ID=MMETSP0086_2-20121207/8238_1 /TAXON_ID=136419 /ORGANISM="Unknown Unknown, Strain D1" /LENGTH=411 /DNA_ID=CAMNT_0016376851 /DNA_START=110 /DNA_END=1345 /DNA_ORIENTATION=-
MNNRQAGAHREMIRKEEKAREVWESKNSQYLDGGEDLGPGDAEDVPERAASQQGDPTVNYNPDPAQIYDRALRISSPRMADDNQDDIARTTRKKVIRQVEVPYTRTVKVPVKTRKIVPIKVQKKVKTKKLVEVPSFKMVDETYTEVVEQPAVRNKEIWVKKIVPERYMQKVPITKTRQVKVPTTVIKEVDDYEIVEVGGSKAIEVDGYRVDTVEDSKLVEVEEFQTYEFRPFAAGPAKLLQSKEVGPVRQKHHSRAVGNEVFHVNDERLRDIDLDSVPDDVARQGLARPQSQGGYGGQPQSQRGASGSQSQRGRTPSRGGRPAATAPRQQAGPIGMKLRNTNSNGVVVYQVNPGEAAERAGVHTNDVITYVNNRPTRNLTEFREVLNNSAGPLLVQVGRRGVRKLMLTIMR